MIIQQVITAVKDEAGVWTQGATVTLNPFMVVGVSEAEGHAIIYTPSGPFYVWPNKAAVDTFLSGA